MPNNYNSDIITKTTTPLTQQSAGLVNGDDLSGQILYATCQITTNSTWTANDTIQLCDLPVGAVVIPQLSHLNSNALGTTLTFNVGDAGDVDRYAAGISKSAGGQVGFGSTTTQPAAAIAPYRIDSEANRRLFATISSASAVTNNLPLVVTLAYRRK